MKVTSQGWPNPNPYCDYEFMLENIKKLMYHRAREVITQDRINENDFAHESSICTQQALESKTCRRWLAAMHYEFRYHRKLWEHAFIAEAAHRAGGFRNMRMLGFGCGTEALPSLFALGDAQVTATDLPSGKTADEWARTGQHAACAQACIVSHMGLDKAAQERVEFQFVDMRDIPATLRGYDFCWSSCALEHLGSLSAGFKFITDSLDTLRPRGVAVHTFEFNLEDGPTVDNWSTVLYQTSHIEQYVSFLESHGHYVAPRNYDRGSNELDAYTDTPPWDYSGNVPLHMKLSVDGIRCTSFALIIQAGDK